MLSVPPEEVCGARRGAAADRVRVGAADGQVEDDVEAVVDGGLPGADARPGSRLTCQTCWPSTVPADLLVAQRPVDDLGVGVVRGLAAGARRQAAGQAVVLVAVAAGRRAAVQGCRGLRAAVDVLHDVGLADRRPRPRDCRGRQRHRRGTPASSRARWPRLGCLIDAVIISWPPAGAAKSVRWDSMRPEVQLPPLFSAVRLRWPLPSRATLAGVFVSTSPVHGFGPPGAVDAGSRSSCGRRAVPAAPGKLSVQTVFHCVALRRARRGRWSVSRRR